jgi:type IV secretion system protein VirD4
MKSTARRWRKPSKETARPGFTCRQMILKRWKKYQKKLGNYTVSTYALSASHGKYSTPSNSHSINLTGRALLTADEVRLISRPFSLITSRNNPAIMYSPDLSEWSFNKMLGLGDREHNRRVREIREKRRKERTTRVVRNGAVEHMAILHRQL